MGRISSGLSFISGPFYRPIEFPKRNSCGLACLSQAGFSACLPYMGTSRSRLGVGYHPECAVGSMPHQNLRLPNSRPCKHSAINSGDRPKSSPIVRLDLLFRTHSVRRTTKQTNTSSDLIHQRRFPLNFAARSPFNRMILFQFAPSRQIQFSLLKGRLAAIVMIHSQHGHLPFRENDNHFSWTVCPLEYCGTN
jgi:hypothetical protein